MFTSMFFAFDMHHVNFMLVRVVSMIFDTGFFPMIY
jgi:hypothetical protein